MKKKRKIKTDCHALSQENVESLWVGKKRGTVKIDCYELSQEHIEGL